MELSILLAKIISVYLLSVGILVLTKGITIKKLYQGFFENPAVTFITGFMMLIMGFLMVEHHNIWEGQWWIVVITLFGWASIIKGVIFLAFPKSLKFFKPLYESLSKGNKVQAWACIILIIGLVFGYYGFIA